MADDAPDEMDKEADDLIASCLQLDAPKSFFLFAGAGSGKTRSLIEAIKHVRDTAGRRLSLTRQKIGVITYTNAACDEIRRRLDYDPRVDVSTIHAFAWSLISGHNTDIKAWLERYLVERIAKLESEISATKNRNTQTFEDKLRSLESRRRRLAALPSIKQFIYSPTGDNRTRDALNHYEVIAITSRFLTEKPTLQRLLVSRYPILLVDESQDTNKDLMESLLAVQQANSSNFALGLLGDMMQRIYNDGKVDLGKGLEGWAFPRKLMNHRCPHRVIRLLNRIRREADGGETTQKGRGDKPEGVVRLFAIQENGADKAAIESRIAAKMAKITEDNRWADEPRSFKTLTLEHHMAAVRFGFLEMFAPIYAVDRLQTSLLEGTSLALNFFGRQVLPTVKAIRANDAFALANVVRRSSPLLTQEALKSDGARQLDLARKGTKALTELFAADAAPSFQAVLTCVAASGLFTIPDALVPLVGPDRGDVEEPDPDTREARELSAWREMLDTDFAQIGPYDEYVTGRSPFGTHQGVKGLEFPRVMVVMSDAEARGFMFKYDKLFGVEPLSSTDQKHISEGEETGIDRTRRLFYVTCSRAEESLALVCYTKSPDVLIRNVVDRGWFEAHEVELLS